MEEEVHSPIDEAMEETTAPLLEYTETLQISYSPDMEHFEDVKQCRCDACKDTIESLKHSSWRGEVRRRKNYGRQEKELVKRFLEFAKEMKIKLKDTCAKALFSSPIEITALAPGISKRTICRMGHTRAPNTEGNVHTRKKRRLAAVKKHGPAWGEIVKQTIHQKLRDEEGVTMRDLLQELSSAHENFTLSYTTLYRLVRGLDFSYKKNQRQRIIFERSDLVAKRERYLKAIALAREKEEYLVYMDET
ncbi:unnamed protein product [Cylicocyclus nassatus]|uniref:Winged helix-turn helix domain-containing protein n=1 Tax=Cylicocyclus nassatus TaxID=53992 RepID=A0AA36GT82_CYLNA|nr:unnamed protein product [Cylicocyclus nassatus]